MSGHGVSGEKREREVEEEEASDPKRVRGGEAVEMLKNVFPRLEREASERDLLAAVHHLERMGGDVRWLVELSERAEWPSVLPQIWMFPLVVRMACLEHVSARARGAQMDLTTNVNAAVAARPPDANAPAAGPQADAGREELANGREFVDTVRLPTTEDPFNDLTRPEVFISKKTADFNGDDVDPSVLHFPAFLRHVLEHLGMRTFHDTETIRSGLEIGEAIAHVVPACRLLIVLLSANANKSKWLKMEVATAACSGTPILPVLFGAASASRGDFPAVLDVPGSHVQAFDLRASGEARARSVDRLERVVSRAWRALGRPGSSPSRARVLEAYTYAECTMFEWHVGGGKLLKHLQQAEHVGLVGNKINLAMARALRRQKSAASAELSAMASKMHTATAPGMLVFISHAANAPHPELPHVLHAALAASGVGAFGDMEVTKGEVFAGDLEAGLRSCPLVVSLLSVAYGQSDWCRMEACAALAWDKLFVPVLADVQLSTAAGARDGHDRVPCIPPAVAVCDPVGAFLFRPAPPAMARGGPHCSGTAAYAVDVPKLLEMTLGRILKLLQRPNHDNVELLRRSVQRGYIAWGMVPPAIVTTRADSKRLEGDLLTLPPAEQLATASGARGESVEGPGTSPWAASRPGASTTAFGAMMPPGLEEPYAYVISASSGATAPSTFADKLFADLVCAALAHLRVRVEAAHPTAGALALVAGAAGGAGAAPAGAAACDRPTAHAASLLRSARVVVAVLSPATNGCATSKSELSHALDASKDIVPLWVDCQPEDMPPAIRTFRGEKLVYATGPLSGAESVAEWADADAQALRLDSNLTALGRLLNSLWRVVQEVPASRVDSLKPHQVRLALSAACRTVFVRRAAAEPSGGHTWPPPLHKLPPLLFSDMRLVAGDKIVGRGKDHPLELLCNPPAVGGFFPMPELARPLVLDVPSVSVEPWRPSASVPQVYILSARFDRGHGAYTATQAMVRVLRSLLVGVHVHLEAPSLERQNAEALHSCHVLVAILTDAMASTVSCKSVLRTAIEWQRSVIPVFCAGSPSDVPRVVAKFAGVVPPAGALDHAAVYNVVRAVLDLLGGDTGRTSNAAIRKQMMA